MHQVDIIFGIYDLDRAGEKADHAQQELMDSWSKNKQHILGTGQSAVRGMLGDERVLPYAQCARFAGSPSGGPLCPVAQFRWFTHDVTAMHDDIEAFATQYHIPVFYSEQEVNAQILG